MLASSDFLFLCIGRRSERKMAVTFNLTITVCFFLCSCKCHTWMLSAVLYIFSFRFQQREGASGHLDDHFLPEKKNNPLALAASTWFCSTARSPSAASRDAALWSCASRFVLYTKLRTKHGWHVSI